MASNDAAAITWIASQAYVEQRLDVDEVFQLLHDMRLLNCPRGCRSTPVASSDQCHEWLPPSPEIPMKPWVSTITAYHSRRVVTLPVVCKGAFIGKGGTTIRTLQAAVERELVLAYPRVVPEHIFETHVKLQISVGTVNVTVAGRGSLVVEAALEAAAEVAAKALRGHVAYLYQDHLEKSRQRREVRQERFAEYGRAYHERCREEREACHARCSAERALALPEGGLAIAPPGLNGRKEPGRRQVWLRLFEKRRTLLRACALVAAPMRREPPRGSSRPLPRRCVPAYAAAARRLARQAASIATTVSTGPVETLQRCGINGGSPSRVPATAPPRQLREGHCKGKLGKMRQRDQRMAVAEGFSDNS